MSLLIRQMVTYNDRYGLVHQVISGKPFKTGELMKKCKDAATDFEEHFAGDELITEIKSFYGLYKKNHPETDSACTALSVIQYIYDNRLHEIYPNLNFLRMFLTIPLTVASGERPF